MQRALPTVLLAIVLGVSAVFYWNQGVLTESKQKDGGGQSAVPGVYLKTTRSWTYNEHGALTNILEADSVVQYPQREESLLHAPRFYAHSGDDKTWSVTADSGQFQHHLENLHLQDNVVLTHDQTGSRLLTTAMDINLQEKTATSKQQVTITDGPNNTQAYGMIAYLETEEILLTPDVESIYVQPRP